MKKIRNIGFVRNLILSNSCACEFWYDDNVICKAQIPLGPVPRNFLADLLETSPTSS